ncbi:MAG: MerR family transcriptional regulator [Rhizomicrobium sp.]
MPLKPLLTCPQGPASEAFSVDEETSAVTPKDANLSPAETAKLLGLSIKALRLYEDRGLVTPMRTQADWRVYGPAQIARPHQIVALKRLGLPFNPEIFAFVQKAATKL